MLGAAKLYEARGEGEADGEGRLLIFQHLLRQENKDNTQFKKECERKIAVVFTLGYWALKWFYKKPKVNSG